MTLYSTGAAQVRWLPKGRPPENVCRETGRLTAMTTESTGQQLVVVGVDGPAESVVALAWHPVVVVRGTDANGHR
jgi:hypothetical protein